MSHYEINIIWLWDIFLLKLILIYELIIFKYFGQLTKNKTRSTELNYKNSKLIDKKILRQLI